MVVFESTLAQYAETATHFTVRGPFPNAFVGIGIASSVARADVVPVISRFYGIVIVMYHREHGAPHFHASYGDKEASVDIRTGRVHGDLPPQVRKRVLAWLDSHRGDLLDNWNRARSHRPLRPIAPLE